MSGLYSIPIAQTAALDKIVIFFISLLWKNISRFWFAYCLFFFFFLEKESFLTVSVWWCCRHEQDVSAEHQHCCKNKYWFNLGHLQIGLLWRDGTWCECECGVWLFLFCCVVSDWSKMLIAPQRNVYRTRNLSENHISICCRLHVNTQIIVLWLLHCPKIICRYGCYWCSGLHIFLDLFRYKRVWFTCYENIQ